MRVEVRQYPREELEALFEQIPEFEIVFETVFFLKWLQYKKLPKKSGNRRRGVEGECGDNNRTQLLWEKRGIGMLGGPVSLPQSDNKNEPTTKEVLGINLK